MSDFDPYNDDYDPEPDYDRPSTNAEAEADEAGMPVRDEEFIRQTYKNLTFAQAYGADEETLKRLREQAEPERACWICDGLGHGYVVGWEEVPGKGRVPILSSPCPLEDQGASDPDEAF